MQGHMQQNRMG